MTHVGLQTHTTRPKRFENFDELNFPSERTKTSTSEHGGRRVTLSIRFEKYRRYGLRRLALPRCVIGGVEEKLSGRISARF